jgi:small-conductance mechanosensitive channel
VDLFGIKLIGANSGTVARAALTIIAVLGVLGVRALVLLLVRGATGGANDDRVVFWTRQGSALAAFALLLLIGVSIWFDNPARLTTVAGFATAGLAIAAQRAVTAFAGYLVVMRGNTFTVGDRIKMGGVRGDVIALGFLQTRILEMGQPPDVNEQEDPGMWVRARQYSGRLVTLTNDKVFDEPVFNYTRELPFIWEEISVGISYGAKRDRAEAILSSVASQATRDFGPQSAEARGRFEARYNIRLDQAEPRVYWRLTDNWLELTVRFLVPEHGIRDVKDAIARDILSNFEKEQIEIASATFEIVGMPAIRLQRSRPAKEPS